MNVSEKKELTKDDLRQMKCPRCDDTVTKYKAIHHTNGRYYHESCFNEWRNRASDRDSLISYVMELYNIKRPTGMMLMQIKRFHEEFGYKYKGMELTLRYFYEILGNNVREGDGLGIIPYIYEEATEQFKRQISINESVEKNKNKEREKRIVYVEKEKKDKNLIDIESI